MLLEGAIGDAYGSGFEYADENLPFNNLTRYVKHPTYGLGEGTYTDDTQMSIALAELMLSNKPWSAPNIANKFVECFKRDYRNGYARHFQTFLESIDSGDEFLKEIKPDSDKSGGAMRASCVGLFRPIEEVLEKTTIQCRLTHNTPDGIAAAQASSLLTHCLNYDRAHPKEVGEYINNYVKGRDWNEDYVGKVKAQGWMSVRAAITAVKRNTSLSALLKDCVAFSGDVDTVATIALSAASCSKYYKKDLPEVLFNGLENGRFGRDFLIDLDSRLFNSFKFIL